MKSRQFCSVCKEWLEMEVVPTSDGEEDDGVIWFRCPQCQGFLPKLSGADLKNESRDDSGPQESSASDGEPGTRSDPVPDTAADSADGSEASVTESSPEGSAKTADSVSETASETTGAMPWDSPADMMAARQEGVDEVPLPDLADIPVENLPDDDQESSPAPAAPDTQETAEPLHQYAAMLAAKDQSQPTPYRPWESYEVGQCIHHQAWEDCGVVVAKEKLPGNRQVIKCYFEEAGVVRLIEMAPR